LILRVNAGSDCMDPDSDPLGDPSEVIGTGHDDCAGKFPKITVKETMDFVESVKHFCKSDVIIVASALVRALETNEGRTFDELRVETGLGTQSLNHALINMKNWGFVEDTGKQRSKVYYITKYGYIIYLSFDSALKNVDRAIDEADKLFSDS
jgi:hypothetical protein